MVPSFTVVNLFDNIYELRDGTGIGVFAPQSADRFAFRRFIQEALIMKPHAGSGITQGAQVHRHAVSPRRAGLPHLKPKPPRFFNPNDRSRPQK